MKSQKLLLAALALLLATSCNNRTAKPDATATAEETRRPSTPDESSDGTPVISFTMDDIDGNPVAVGDVFAKHKLTVVDFWASWCGPCRSEMPSLVKLHRDYGGAGLGIIGVSLDEDKDQWAEAVESMGMEWLQLSDLQGWDNSAARMYGIRSIPFTIIVDNKGRLLAAGLRGEQLQAFVKDNLPLLQK